MNKYPELHRGLIKTGDGEDANYFQVYETRYDDLNWERWSLFGSEITDDGGQTWIPYPALIAEEDFSADESSASLSLPAADQEAQSDPKRS